MKKIELYKELIEKEINGFISQNYNNGLGESIIYSIKNGGKRIRPVLALCLSRELDVDDAHIIKGIIALEFIHTFSLIQDDLPSFDDSDMRRGNPTVHKRFNEWTALLASDALIFDAMHLLSQLDNSDKILRMANECAGFKGLLYGQYLDMSTEPESFDDIYKIFYNKTARLFELSYAMGAIVSAKEKVYVQLEKIGEYFGIAFQIHNDIRSPEKEGKGILKIYSREKAMEIFTEYIGRSKEIYGILKKNESIEIFNEIYEMMEL